MEQLFHINLQVYLIKAACSSAVFEMGPVSSTSDAILFTPGYHSFMFFVSNQCTLPLSGHLERSGRMVNEWIKGVTFLPDAQKVDASVLLALCRLQAPP